MPSALAVKQTYPQLFSGRQMLAEFQRITNLDIDHLIQEYCVKHANNIITIAKYISGANIILRQAEEIKQQNAALKQYWHCCCFFYISFNHTGRPWHNLGSHHSTLSFRSL
jgi:hypothetical protein